MTTALTPLESAFGGPLSGGWVLFLLTLARGFRGESKFQFFFDQRANVVPGLQHVQKLQSPLAVPLGQQLVVRLGQFLHLVVEFRLANGFQN